MNIKQMFENKRLIQIAIGQFDFNLHFHDGLSLLVSDSIYLECLQLKAFWNHNPDCQNLELFLTLLNEEVKEAIFSEAKGLRIKIANCNIVIPKPVDNEFEYLHINSKEQGVFIY